MPIAPIKRATSAFVLFYALLCHLMLLYAMLFYALLPKGKEIFCCEWFFEGKNVFLVHVSLVKKHQKICFQPIYCEMNNIKACEKENMHC